MVFIVILVSAGFSVAGAIGGSICATCVELLVARYFVRPRLFAEKPTKWPAFWSYIIPLAAFSLSMRVFDKLDLVLLKSLGATTAVAGFYGAAQNLSILPAIITSSFSPLLLSTLSRWISEKKNAEAEELVRDSWRMILLMLPFASVVAGSGTEIAALFFGPDFFRAGPIVSLLIIAAVADTAVLVNASYLPQSENHHGTFFSSVPYFFLLSSRTFFLYLRVARSLLQA